MIKLSDFSEILQKVLEWISTHILSLDFAFQLSVILIAFGVGLIAHKFFGTRFDINSVLGKNHFLLRDTLKKFNKLVFPLVSIVVMSIGAALLKASEIQTYYLLSATKLLLAWVVIKIIVQFIRNNFARQMATFIIWTIAALSILGILDETSSALDSLGLDIGSFRLSALTVTKGLLALMGLIYIATLLANIVEKQISKSTSLSPSSRVLIAKVARVFLFITAVLVGITTAGIDLSLLAVFSGALGLGIGFGLQKGMSNLFSGVLLLMDESIKPGDIIELPSPDGKSSTFGWVNHMGARYTEIVTRDNKSYLVPNEDFITQKVVNWSHGDTLIRVETKFGVHYDSDPHEVKRIAEEAAATAHRVVESPQPLCWLVEFGDSSLNFVLRYWIRDAEKGITNTKGMVMMAIWDAFKKHGIKVPYPQREITVRTIND